MTVVIAYCEIHLDFMVFSAMVSLLGLNIANYARAKEFKQREIGQKT